MSNRTERRRSDGNRVYGLVDKYGTEARQRRQQLVAWLLLLFVVAVCIGVLVSSLL